METRITNWICSPLALTLLAAWLTLIPAFQYVPVSAPHSISQENEDAKGIEARATEAKYTEAVELVGIPGLRWTGDPRAALSQGYKDKRLVFLAFTAATNLHCVLNHKGAFAKEPVREAMQPYVLVMLYADGVPAVFFKEVPSDEVRRAEAVANLELKWKAFVTSQMPLYAIIKPVGENKFEIVAVYDEGRVKNEEMFVKFLHEPFRPAKRSDSGERGGP
jgi:hypothetical protein